MNSILIRAEDKNIWERRTPLVPADLNELLSEVAVPAYIEQSDKRVFPVEQYLRIGASVCHDMQPGNIILGIKEIPAAKILPDKVYVFFSHTIKGMKSNIPMLKKIIDSGSTLIDYEKVTDDQGLRLIYFGNFAGDAGAINILWLMGQYWQSRGILTPFQQVKQALNYAHLSEAKTHIREIGQQIESQGLPLPLCPLIIGIMGYGNVSQGAQDVFKGLPTEYVDPENLSKLVQRPLETQNKIYLTVFKEKHLVRHIAGKPFSKKDYFENPQNYISQFEKYLPDISILVNAVYWDKRYPRFVTWDNLKNLASQPDFRLQGIADITCDVNGSIECNVKSTHSGMPAYLCDPETRTITDGYQGKGILVLAVDNLPAEIAYDASMFFSKQFKPFVPNLIQADYSQPLERSGLCPEIRRGVIVYRGKLTEPYQYLMQYLER